MKTSLVLPTLLLTVQQMNHTEHSTTINQVLQQVFQATKPLNVQFIIQDILQSESTIIDEIYKTVSRTLPTSCISLNDSIPTELLSLSVSGGTLILYVYASESSLNLQQMENIIRAVVYTDNRSNVLLVTILKNQRNDYEILLKKMWEKKLLNVVVLELSQLDGLTMTVHQYNPFSNIYDRQPYNSSIQLFPDKLVNLHGYPLVMYVMNRTGHMNLRRNSQGYPVFHDGPDAKTLKALIRVLNFTYVSYPYKDQNPFLYLNGEVDSIFTTLPYIAFTPYDIRPKSTLAIDFENWCPVISLRYKHESKYAIALIQIALHWSMVLAVWLISVCLKFDSNSWEPFKIFGMLISASMSVKATRMIERIVLLGVFLLSAIYSTVLYANFAKMSLYFVTEVDYKSFEELDKSGLIPVIINVSINNVFIGNDEAALSLQKKAITMHNLADCIPYMVEHGNVSCFIELNMAKTFLYAYIREGRHVMKICTNLCYMKPPVGYFFERHSPYVDRFTDLIMRLEVAGLRDRWYRDHLGEFLDERSHRRSINHHSLITVNLATLVVFGGFLSLLVFIGELVTYRVRNRNKTLTA